MITALIAFACFVAGVLAHMIEMRMRNDAHVRNDPHDPLDPFEGDVDFSRFRTRHTFETYEPRSHVRLIEPTPVEEARRATPKTSPAVVQPHLFNPQRNGSGDHLWVNGKPIEIDEPCQTCSGFGYLIDDDETETDCPVCWGEGVTIEDVSDDELPAAWRDWAKHV